MDHFEQIVVRLLECRGYWARRSVYVDLTKEDKRALGKPSMPRPEIDVVAYKPADNEILVLEVKSWLDSVGVAYTAFSPPNPSEGRLKILTDEAYQRLLSARLVGRLAQEGLVLPGARVRFGLAAGRVKPGDGAKVREHAAHKGWIFISPREISDWVKSRCESAYENDPVTLAAKLVLRDHGTD